MIEETRIAKVRAQLPEYQEFKAKRFQETFGLSLYDASVLTSERELANFFEEVVKKVAGAVPHKICANWVLSEFLREVNQREWGSG